MIVSIFAYLIQALFVLVVGAFALYVVLELRVLLISRRVERRKLSELVQSTVALQQDWYPKVSVLLPIYNEAAVVERLIDAACRLDYPVSALEILVLDDSTDQTALLAQNKVDQLAKQGVPIRRIQRTDRSGYKAGNLVHGIQHSQGEFLRDF